MVFKRRDRPPLSHRLRAAVYPRKGWTRAAEYIGMRVRRIPDTPHRIALGFACGAFASFSPFFGLHLLYAFGLARLVRGNALAALIGTVVGNPLTFPVIAALSMALGRRILGAGATGRDFGRIVEAFRQAGEGLWAGLLSVFGLAHADWAKLAAFGQDVLLPYFVGGLLPGLVAAIASYYAVRAVVAAYQAARRARLAARRGATPLRDGG